MSRQFFTEEQIESLRQNPYVYSVSAIVLVLRKEFKEIFYAEYKEGALPREILRKYGFDPSILGKGRISSIARNIKKEYAKYGGFYEGRRPADRSEAAKAAGQNSPEEELRSIRHELEYMRQEMEYLKKNSAVRTSKK